MLPLAGSLAVSTTDMALLFTFGALNLGLGMALFVTGARLLPRVHRGAHRDAGTGARADLGLAGAF
jgi:hypothetical protein